jgi:AAA family ATP:ADP antiporter
MQIKLDPSARSFTALGRKIVGAVDIKPDEMRAALLSFAYFFCLLCAYYIVRPVRDEMGVTVGKGSLKDLFSVVFLVMLAAVPLFGWIVSAVEKRRVVAVIYGFFIATMLLFWLGLRTSPESRIVAGSFFIWASVFNLFVISLFWSVMSDLWSTEQAKRLYGFFAAGGSVGAFAGPIVTQVFVRLIGPNNLLPVSAAFLGLAILVAAELRRSFARHAPAAAVESSAKPIEGGVLDGAVRVWQSPYLFRIALVILIANLVSTFFYLEQSHIVGETLKDRAARVELFSRLDLAVNIATVLLQVFVTGRVMQRYGVALAAASLPVVAILGLIALSIAPVLAVVVAVMTAERAVAFSLASPAVKSLYTVVSAEDKYKAQNFIDTVVYRGGDAASGWLFGWLGRDGLGLATGLVSFITIPLAVLWLWLTVDLGRRQNERAGETSDGPGKRDADAVAEA